MFVASDINGQLIPPPSKNLGEKASNSYVEQYKSANGMPILSEAVTKISKMNASNSIIPEMRQHSVSQIFAKRGAPSSISSERFLKSRALFSPEFIHNEAASRINRVSNFYQEFPRFINDIDILA
jgi:hypothetical protein